jgi:Zn-dependent M16 (insulinase) family peptidase
MAHVLDAWIYGVDPLTFLRMGDHLAACRRRYDDDPRVFNRLIEARLLENTHRLTVVLKPDREWQARTEAAFAEQMATVRGGMSDEAVDRMAADAAELDRLNSEPNSPEALAKLPQLTLGDLPEKPRHIPVDVGTVSGGVTLLRNDVFSNGVNYVELAFDLTGMDDGLWPYLPRYCDAIRKLGAAGMDYEAIAKRVAASTGGLDCRPTLLTHAEDSGNGVHQLRFVMKALDDTVEPALGVLHDLVFSVEPGDRTRMLDVLSQSRAWYRTNLVQRGMHTATLHASRGLTPEGHLWETINGVPQLPLMERLAGGFEAECEALTERIEAIRDFLLARGRLTVCFTGSDTAYATFASALEDWIGAMRDEPIGGAAVDFKPYDAPPREGLAGPVQVAFCVQEIPAPHFSHPDEPLLRVAAHLVRHDYILPEIRFKGNAYGAGFRHDGFASKIGLHSYRDPHVARTLQVFGGVTDYVKQAAWSEADVHRGIIAVAKEDERPIRPGTATTESLLRHLTGQTRAAREARYARLLGIDVAEAKRALLEVLEKSFDKSPVCVVSNRQKLEQANEQMPDGLLAIEDILAS